MKKKKLKLKELEVQSFITSSPELYEETPNIKGGTVGWPCIIIGVFGDQEDPNAFIPQWVDYSVAMRNNLTPYKTTPAAALAAAEEEAARRAALIMGSAASLALSIVSMEAWKNPPNGSKNYHPKYHYGPM